LNQINDLNLSTSDYEISESIVNSIDETGRLADSLSEIEEFLDYRYAYKTIENNLINVIHELSPSGVGFRDFKECIFLQIKKSSVSNIELEIANKILYEISSDDLDECFNNLVYSGYDEKDVKKTIQVIRNCDLSPGLNYEETNYIYPDLKITLESNDKISTQFVTDNFPSIVLDEEFVKETKKALKKDPNEGLLKNIEEAKWLISSIRRRNETVLKVGEMICKRQIDFLGSNPLKVSPLTNKDISDELGVHPSTISRIIKSKYIDTPKGIIPLKSFLASSVSRTRMVTPLQLMDQIKKIIDEEKNPLSDQKIVQMLNLRGFGLARRTITKYRKQLNIPSSRNR
jgi:RNA polymerase sigma-54 factor